MLQCFLPRLVLFPFLSCHFTSCLMVMFINCGLSVLFLQLIFKIVFRCFSCWSNAHKIDNIEHLRQLEDSLRESLNQIQMEKVKNYNLKLFNFDTNFLPSFLWNWPFKLKKELCNIIQLVRFLNANGHLRGWDELDSRHLRSTHF